MKVLVRNHGPEGGTSVEVIDASDGAVSHQANVAEGEQIVVVATSAHSPADIEFGEVEGIPVEEPAEEAEAPADPPEDADPEDAAGDPPAGEPQGDEGETPDGAAA